jgi:mono/diheme cytochrome c family protein
MWSAMRTGDAMYVDNCSTSHTESGTGLPGLFPPLKGNPVVQAPESSIVIRMVLEGGKNTVTAHPPTGAAMPAMAWKLSDEQIAAVITYIRNNWQNAASGRLPS